MEKISHYQKLQRQPKNLTNNSADNFEANFAPDGKFIVYRSNKGAADELTYNIWVMSSDGSNQTNITQQLKDTSEFNPCWSW